MKYIRPDLDSRERFNYSWLTESPEGIGNFPIDNSFLNTIKLRIDNGEKPEELSKIYNGLFKLEGRQIIYYWIEQNSKIQIAVELEKSPQCLKVNMLVKLSSSGQPPYATDLYKFILDDQKDNYTIPIRLMSDKQLSDDGLKVWKRLVDDNMNIYVYDREIPGQSFIKIDTSDDLDKYIKLNDKSFQRYQFVLAKNKEIIGETISFFGTRRMRELSGLDLGEIPVANSRY